MPAIDDRIMYKTCYRIVMSAQSCQCTATSDIVLERFCLTHVGLSIAMSNVAFYMHVRRQATSPNLYFYLHFILPEHVTSAPSVAVFRSRLKTHLYHIPTPCDCTVPAQ